MCGLPWCLTHYSVERVVHVCISFIWQIFLSELQHDPFQSLLVISWNFKRTWVTFKQFTAKKIVADDNRISVGSFTKLSH